MDFLSRQRLAAARLVAVEALARLLAEAAELAHAVGAARVHEVGPLAVAALADLPADVVARHVVHRERTHRHAPALQRPVDLLRARAPPDPEAGLLRGPL